MIVETVNKIVLASMQILNDASVWLVMSFALAGLLHNFLKPDRLQRMLGNRKFSSLVRGTVSGMLLPICSCGVIPLGLGLYYSGAYLGPTLAFMTATPIINPAAMLLAYGLLGPQIATIYLISGFFVPMVVGVIGNALGGPELQAPGLEQSVERIEMENADEIGLYRKLSAGLHWGFMDLGVMVSKYIVMGVFLAGLIMAVVPKSMIQDYLGNPGMISLAGVAVLGAVMYVCAVGHIPFIAALVASGAAPGIAVTFLMTGAATNLPELISIYKIIGKRAVAIYTLTMVTLSMLIGYMTNLLLLQEFIPFFNQAETTRMIGLANKLIVSAPKPLEYLCSGVILALFVHAYLPRIRQIFAGPEVSG
ncbi:MAG: efflux transporter SaoE [Syntrophobacteraceae bacterium]